MFGLPKKTSALLARSKPIFYSCTLIVASRFHNETTCTYVTLNMNIVLLLFVAELNFKLVMARTGVNLSKGLLTQAKLSYHCMFFSITCRLNIHHLMMPKICSSQILRFITRLVICYWNIVNLLLQTPNESELIMSWCLLNMPSLFITWSNKPVGCFVTT